MAVQPVSARSAGFVLMMFSAFLCYLALIMPLSSLSLFVTRDLEMSNLAAGIAAGSAFFATMLYRKPAGDRIDRTGGKRCFLQGAAWYTAAGALCLLASIESLPPAARLVVLLAGRALQGIGECLCNVSMACWAVDLIGIEKSGRIFATLGMSMYAAAAVGGQAGFYLFQNHGYGGLMLVSALSPLAAYGISRALPEAAKEPGRPELPEAARPRVSILHVFRLISRVGFVSMLCAVGFAVIGAFLSKTFLDRGWEYAGLAFTACGVGFVAMRPCFGHLPDRIGGMPVAALSAAVELVGMAVLCVADSSAVALAGSFLTGAGVSMVLPANGSDIAKRVPLAIRGTCLSCYNIFTDVAYGFAAPAAGFFTDMFGDGAAYRFAGLCVAAGVVLAGANLRRSLARRS